MFPSPYGEVGFDHIMRTETTITNIYKFPSPYGEVGFDREDAGVNAYEYVGVFPSPYGEVGFDLGFTQAIREEMTKVSVPLRGSWF